MDQCVGEDDGRLVVEGGSDLSELANLEEGRAANICDMFGKG